MMAMIRKTYHVVVHRKPVTPVIANVITLGLSALVTLIMVGIMLITINAEVRTEVDGRKHSVTVINGEPVDLYALYIRTRWMPVDRLTYVRCQLRDEFPRCARVGEQ